MTRLAPVALLAAALASIATSAPAWTLSDHDGGAVRTERGEGARLDLLLAANAAALPEVEGGVSPQGGAVEGGLSTTLEVDLELRSQGTFGVGREPTHVVAELWMETAEGDWLVDEAEVEVGLEEPAAVGLFADGVFAGCAPGTDCDAVLAVRVAQEGDAKLKIRYDARVRVSAPLVGPAPDDAELAVVVSAR